VELVSRSGGENFGRKKIMLHYWACEKTALKLPGLVWSYLAWAGLGRAGWAGLQMFTSWNWPEVLDP